SPCSRSRSTVRQIRTSAAARRACRPSCRSRTGASCANVAQVGGARKVVPSTRGNTARTMPTSSSRARRESINCPQKARSSVCATVGRRSWRIPTVAQTLLRAFCGQLIDSRRARELEVGIVRAVLPRVEGTTLRAPPTCATFAQLAPVRLRQLGLHARRAAALVRICRTVDLERLHGLTTAKAAAFIERERGLGPWSAGVVCLEGLGRHE